MVPDLCHFDLDIKPDFDVSTFILGYQNVTKILNNQTRTRVEIDGATRERNLNESGWLETLNSEYDSISMKWSVDNVALDGLEATYLTFSFKVNYLYSYYAYLFAEISDEIDQSVESVVISGDRSVKTVLGTA